MERLTGNRAADLQAAAAIVTGPTPLGGGPTPLGIASPWAPEHHLATVWNTLLEGREVDRPLTRAEAMRVPEVSRARGIICTTIARIPLGDYRGDVRLPDAEAAPWIGATSSALSPFHRMLWTCDDLYFYGWSLWRRTRNAAATDGGFPLAQDRVPIGQWYFEPGTGRVMVAEPHPDNPGESRYRAALAGEVTLIPGIGEGILVDGVDTIRHAADLHRAANRTARHPSAYLGLKQTTGAPLKRRSDDDTEVTVETVLRDWRNARNNPEGGGVAWLGGVEPHEFGSFSEHLVVEGRNAAAVDVARHSNIPADLIDAVMAQSSLQYSTSRDNDRRAIDYGLGAFMSAISSALSMDTVHPRGRRVAFDLEEWLRGAAPAPGQEPADTTTQEPAT